MKMEKITVDAFRRMLIPAGWRQINVGNDSCAESAEIEVPRYYGAEKTDLSVYPMYLKTVSALGRDDILLEPQVYDDKITAVWTLRPPQTSCSGPLFLQLRFEGNDFKWETPISQIEILPSADAQPVVPATPSAYEEWLRNVQAAADSILDLTVSAQSVSCGTPASVEKTEDGEVCNLHFGIPEGTQGPPGNGIARIEKTSAVGNVDTYTITMTDGSTSTFTVTNGETDLSNAVRFDVSQSKTEEEKRRAQKNIGIREIIYSNEGKAWIAQENVDLPSVNNYLRISKLNAGTEYRIVLRFNGSASRFSNAKLSTGSSQSGVIATFLAADFVGESWVTGKEITYTPESNAIVYFWLQFNSAYTGGTTCSFEIYNKDWEEVNVIEETEEKLQGEIDDNKYEIYLEDEYNLLPPDGYEVNKRIGTSGVVSTETGKVVSDYFEIDPSMGYICNWAKTASLVRGNSDLSGNLNCLERYSFAFFDELKQVIPFSGDTNAPSKAIPPNAKYMRVTIPREDLYPLARVIYGNYTSQPIVRLRDYAKRQVSPWNEANTGFEDFSMVMFGDSITHGSLSVPDKPTSYVDFANDYLHSKIVNCGFGGTRMYGDTSSGVGLFSFAGLCEAIVSDDENKWASRIAYAQTDNTSYQIQLNKLMAVDWTKVKAIGLMYGANDFTNNSPISSTYSDANTSFNGACAYGLKLLLTKYPHLQVLIMTPFDRTATGSDISTLSSVVPNGAGYYMKDYGESLKLVQEKYCCPLVDTRKLFGINEYTIFEYCSDGVHPRTNLGQQRLGWLFAQAVKNNIAPFR
jgi:hypothetical protein